METYNNLREPLTGQQYFDQLPPGVRTRLERALQPGERLLWGGWSGINTPGDLWYWLRHCEDGFLKGTGGVFLISLAIFAAGFFTGFGFLVGIGAFFLICLVLLLVVMWASARTYGYALTDRRAIMVSLGDTKSYSDLDPARLKMVEYAPDLTRFFLGQQVYQDSEGEDRQEDFEITARANAAHLRELIETNFYRRSESARAWPPLPIDRPNRAERPL